MNEYKYKECRVVIRPGTFLGYTVLVYVPSDSATPPRKKFQHEDLNDVLKMAHEWIDENCGMVKEG